MVGADLRQGTELLMGWWLRNSRPKLTLGTFPPHLPFNKLQLSAKEQALHAMVVGATGAGKSKWLQSVFLGHLKNSLSHISKEGEFSQHGVTLLDPHNDLSLDILRTLVASGFYKRPDAFERLVYIDFARDHYVPLNILQCDGDQHEWTEKLLEGMSRVWPDVEEGSTFIQYFQAGAVVLMKNNLPISFMYRLFTDDDFLKQCLNRVEDDEIVIYTMKKYLSLGNREREFEAGSTARRAFQLSYQTPTKLTFGQLENKLPFRQYMDEGRFMIFNLAGLSERSRRIIGALLMVLMEQAAMSRFSQLDKTKRLQHTAICDEWPTFGATEKTLQDVLSQGRKYGYNLYLACQSVGQIDAKRLSYAFDNCRLKVFFELGANSSGASAVQIGAFDPYAIKEPEAAESEDLRSPTEHRQYMPLSDQVRLWQNELE